MSTEESDETLKNIEKMNLNDAELNFYDKKNNFNSLDYISPSKNTQKINFLEIKQNKKEINYRNLSSITSRLDFNDD